MSEIKRFNWNGLYGMEELADGDYALYSDHEAAIDSMTAALVKLDGSCLASEQEVARLRAEVEKVRGYEIAPLEAKVAELRTEIEENENVINVWRGRTQRTEAEAEKNRVDAERYRWLRDPDRNVSLVLDKVTGYVEYHEGTQTGGYSTYEYRAGDELDKAIDAAMGEGK